MGEFDGPSFEEVVGPELCGDSLPEWLNKTTAEQIISHLGSVLAERLGSRTIMLPTRDGKSAAIPLDNVVAYVGAICEKYRELEQKQWCELVLQLKNAAGTYTSVPLSDVPGYVARLCDQTQRRVRQGVDRLEETEAELVSLQNQLHQKAENTNRIVLADKAIRAERDAARARVTLLEQTIDDITGYVADGLAGVRKHEILQDIFAALCDLEGESNSPLQEENCA